MIQRTDEIVQIFGVSPFSIIQTADTNTFSRNELHEKGDEPMPMVGVFESECDFEHFKMCPMAGCRFNPEDKG